MSGELPRRETIVAKHLLVVLSNAHEGTDDEFNDWYTNTHIGDIIGLDGFQAAQRYRLSDRQVGDGEGEAPPYRYLAIYEVDGDDLGRAADSLASGVDSGMVISDALDRDRTVAWLFSAITERMEAGASTASATSSR